mgnify:CR=1 FL=1
MQFIDQAIIDVKAGSGGDGISAFRREKYVPAGGPAGGDGGQGGNVVLEADDNLQTLLDFKFQKLISAENGHRGGPNKCTGASGDDTVLKVPCGTEVRHLSTNIILGDLTHKGQQLIVAFGGKGGFGNARYLSNSNRAPEKFTEGKEGEEWTLQLELKLLAEVGIIGLPNAGKSSLLSAITNANPKIANYQFTTLDPNLGVANYDDKEVTVADIPGLVEGAHKGTGLGIKFLKHISRTGLLLIFVDLFSSENLSPLDQINSLQKELEAYKDDLTQKISWIVCNKVDLLKAEDVKKIEKEIQSALNTKDVFMISAFTGKGTRELLNKLETEVCKS